MEVTVTGAGQLLPVVVDVRDVDRGGADEDVDEGGGADEEDGVDVMTRQLHALLNL